MITREQVLKIIRQRGPVIPVNISKELGTQILFASAALSDLVSAGILKVSSLKIGGSPLYYLPEHASRLESFSGNLNPREKEAYNLLKEKKVVRETDISPVMKVCMKSIKDFAFPLKVTVGENSEIFWKWHSISNEEAGGFIKSILNPVPVKSTKSHYSVQEQNTKEDKKTDETKEESKQISSENKNTCKPHEENRASEDNKSLISFTANNKIKKQVSDEFSAENEKNIKKEKPGNTQKGDEFTEKVALFFRNNKIDIVEHSTVRKNEADFVVEIEASLGRFRYYCKAKQKSRVSDSDLSSAYVQGELKKLPVVFLSTGEPTKRAQDMLQNEFKNMVFRKMEGFE